MYNLLKKFMDRFQVYVDEIGMTEDGMCASHQIPARIEVYNRADGELYDIVDLDVGTMMGCGCWHTVYIEVEPRKYDKPQGDNDV